MESGQRKCTNVMMENWAPGYTASELSSAQERYQITFPPDLWELLLDRRPVNGYGWAGEDDRVARMLDWPLDMLLSDVDAGSWLTDWGERPENPGERHEIVRSAMSNAPRLIPLYSHRFIPETPHTVGNPVFSMYGFDTIYYGANLDEYFVNEFEGSDILNGVAVSDYTPEDTRRLPIIPFWSDLALHWDRVIQFSDD